MSIQLQDTWVVYDENGYPIHVAFDPKMCHDHINDAIMEHDLIEADQWVVRKVDVVQFDAMQIKLPHDVPIGHMTFGKGVTLETIVLAMKNYYEIVHGKKADDVAKEPPEERAARREAFLASLKKLSDTAQIELQDDLKLGEVTFHKGDTLVDVTFTENELAGLLTPGKVVTLGPGFKSTVASIPADATPEAWCEAVGAMWTTVKNFDRTIPDHWLAHMRNMLMPPPMVERKKPDDTEGGQWW